jgi:hypothetical protein
VLEYARNVLGFTRRGTRAAACQATRSMERFYCNFALNPEYRDQLEQHGLAINRLGSEW